MRSKKVLLFRNSVTFFNTFFFLTLQVPISGMSDMTPTSLAAVVMPRTSKIIKNGLLVFEGG